ncbi:hypothetical protein [Paenibacillus ferrarius]|uniref:hypothetical protein n=1 Tax=Paenibacillus ferrarius TaxID=1469647 RepID=UPI003D2B293F
MGMGIGVVGMSMGLAVSVRIGERVRFPLNWNSSSTIGDFSLTRGIQLEILQLIRTKLRQKGQTVKLNGSFSCSAGEIAFLG